MESVADGHNRRPGQRERLLERFLRGDAPPRTAAPIESHLAFGMPRRDLQQLAETLIARFRGLTQVLAASPAVLRRVHGVEAQVTTALKLVDHIVQARTCGQPSSGIQGRPASVAVLAAPAEPPVERSKPGTASPIALAQSEMALDLPGRSALPLAQKSALKCPVTPAVFRTAEKQCHAAYRKITSRFGEHEQDAAKASREHPRDNQRTLKSQGTRA